MRTRLSLVLLVAVMLVLFIVAQALSAGPQEVDPVSVADAPQPAAPQPAAESPDAVGSGPASPPPPSSKPPAALPPSRATVKPSAPVFQGPAGEPSPVVYLTFDDGPSPFTNDILSELKRANATATFFMIGQEVVKRAEVAEAVAAAGHSVQNHTHNHPNLTKVSPTRFRTQIQRAQQAIVSATGTTPRCLRPPMGTFNAGTAQRAAQQDLRLTLWSVDSGDWMGSSAAKITDRVLDRVTNGSVVLMHDGGGDRSQTVKAVRAITSRLAQRGYEMRAMPSCSVAS